MHKNLGLLLILVLLLAQSLSQSHIAEHHTDIHPQQDNTACDITLHQQQSDDPDLINLFSIPIPIFNTEKATLNATVAIKKSTFSDSYARAPPTRKA